MKWLNYAIDFCESFEGRSRLELLLLPTIFVRQSTDLWVTRSRRDLQIGVAWLYWEVFYEAA